MPTDYEVKIRPDKVEAVQDIKKRFEGAEAVLLTEYRGLSVPEMQILRARLSDSEVSYRVVKNTLARFAARELGFEELDELFAGPVAVAFCNGDPVAGAKALTEFANDHPALLIKGGVLEGRIMSAEQAEALSKIDMLDVSLAKISGSLTAPLQGIVTTLRSALQSITWTLRGLADAGESGPLGGNAPEGAPAAAEAAPESEEPAEAEAAPVEAEAGGSVEAAPEEAPGDGSSEASEDGGDAEEAPTDETSADEASEADENETQEGA